MGAWGIGNFENDDALDWIYELEPVSDDSVIRAALSAVTVDRPDYLEASECCVALAAAEVVAALNGRPADKLPQEVNDWIQDKPSPELEVTRLARSAVSSVGDDSELRELFAEAEELNAWLALLGDLESRLG